MSRSLRFERKCVADANREHELRLWIEQQRAAFRVAYPTRVVQSLYFDSAELESFGEALSGVSARQKTRLRWYGEDSSVERAVLEAKHKHNEFGWKETFEIQLPVPLTEMTLSSLAVVVAAQLPETRRTLLERGEAPVALIRYRREYYVSADHRIRATLDCDIRVFDQWGSPRLNFWRPTSFPPVSILELKYDAGLDREVRDRLESLPTRLSRFSKYSVGVQSLLGV